ncbi:hypothetical protein QQX98_009987 [Neonectria punicea]|uniref:Uncharacterized protein n=1 Tax=Neonectria punicea TaxID=979145 RepID=A0ABR1GQS5_9HYPO
MGCCKSTPRDPGQHDNGFQDMGPRPHHESTAPTPGDHSPRTVEPAQGSAAPLISDPITGTGPPVSFESPATSVHHETPVVAAPDREVDRPLPAPPAAHEETTGETAQGLSVTSNNPGPSGSSSSSKSTSSSSNANSGGKI